ncbi:MAG: efflux RND transporter permease subunit [Bacteroidales bacterium]|nr:efflux RND transporter permease subunit [Bacteroidales bacterium]
MKIYETAVRRPISTIMIFLGVVVFGLFSLQRLSIDFFPEMDIPFIIVFTPYPGASAADIEKSVSVPIENALNTVSNLRQLTSNSSDNFSMVALQFEWGTNLDEAANDIRDAVAMVEQMLPDEAQRPSIMRINMSMMPILFLAVTAEESFNALDKILEERIINPLNRIDGVGAIGVSGTPVREIQVNLDPVKMEAYHLTIEQIGQVIQTENLNMPAGIMDIGSGTFAIRAEGEFSSSDELKSLVVSRLGGNTVFLSDVAQVRDTIRNITQELMIDGRQGGQIVVQKQSGANTVAISRAVLRELPRLKQDLPPDVEISVLVDMAEFIQGSINSLSQTVLLAFLAVSLVVLFFLGRWRSTFIITLTIPISLTAAFIYLMASGGTINIVTLSALIVCLALVVDDAIVVLENITKHIERGSSPREAAIYGTNEVWLPVIATTLTLIAVFFPFTLVGGMAGMMFAPFAWIVIIVTTVSTLAGITLTPMLSSKLLKFQPKNTYKGLGVMFKPIDKFLDKLDNAYAKILTWALHRRRLIIFSAIGIFIGSIVLFAAKVETDFMPESDESQLTATIELEQGRSLEYTRRVAAYLTDYIRENFPEVETIASLSGAADGANFWAATGTNGSHVINFTLVCVNVRYRDRSVFEMAEELRNKFNSMPEVVRSTVGTGGMGPGGSEIEVKIFGYDFYVAEDFAKKLRDRFAEIEGARDVRLSRDEQRLEYRVVFNRERLAIHGLNTATAALFIRNRINGLIAGQFREDGEEFDIVVRYAEPFRQSIEDVENIQLFGTGGERVRVRDVGRVEEFFSPPSIQREDRQRRISVTMSTHGVALSQVVREVNRILDETEVPQGFAVTVGGAAEDQAEAFGDMILLLLLIILLVYIVLATQFESMRMPFIIMLTLPFAFTGVFLALFITGTSLSLIGFVGSIMLVGIVVKNGVVMVDFTNLLHERGLSINQAVINAGKSRLRPVLMTSITTILAMTPLALGIGEGSEAWQPMGVAIIGGLAFSTLITLIIVPVIYSIFGARTLARRRRRQAKMAEAYEN